MKLTVLGSGTCAVTPSRSCSSYLITVAEQNILLDIGFGALRRMSEASFDYRDIDAILCSHCHLDHVGDLAPLLMATRFTPGFQRKKTLTLIGPPGFKDFLYGCRDLFGDWLLPNDEYPLTIVELSSEQFQLGECLITTKPMNHSRPTNGYRLEHHGRICVYSGDTGPSDELAKLAQNAHVALFECSFPDEQPSEFHLTPGQAGEIAQQAHAEKLILTHFYPMMDKIDVRAMAARSFEGEIVIAHDLDVYII